MTTAATMRIRRSVGQAFADRSRIVLAVSGGVDSMVMLDAAAATTTRERLVVATFDHGTGPHATRAVAHVVARCDMLGIPCVEGRANGASHNEAALRTARWSFLRDVSSRYAAGVCTAHTRDDQIETVFMRVLRGAGARGLSGLYAASETLRPLLSFGRADVSRYAAEQQVEWIEDPSNRSTRFFRNRVRHELLPAMRAVRPTLEAELLSIAHSAAQWRSEVEHLVARHVPVARRSDSGLDVDASALAKWSAEHLRFLLPAVMAASGVPLDRRGTMRLAAFAKEARVGARIQLSGGWQVVRSRDALQLRASGGPEATAAPLALSQRTTWCSWSFEPTRSVEAANPWSALLPTDRPLLIRPWRPGDVMPTHPPGRIRKIKQLLSKAGVTGHERANWPVVVSGDEIVWVPGVRRRDAATAPTGRSGVSFRCEYLDR